MATRINNNNRLHYGVHAVGLASAGHTGTGWRTASGVQSVGIDTSFEIEQVYQLGQLGIYHNIENIPNVEVTIEKLMDRTPLIQHLATPISGFGPELIGRYSNAKADVAVSFFRDSLSNASGTVGVNQCFMSGMYVSSISFNLPSDGNFTESVTLVGNSKNWMLNPSNTYFNPGFGTVTTPPTGTDSLPLISRRQNIVFGQGSSASDVSVSYLPKEIPGIDTTGFNRTTYGGGAWDGFGAHVQSIQVSADLGRTELFELGKRGPYHRYLDFPIEVTCAIEVIDTQGDSIVAQTEAMTNTSDQKIYLVIENGTIIDLGSKNRLTSVSSAGGDTGGGNRTVTYNYVNYNDLTVFRFESTKNSNQIGYAPSSSLDPANATDAQPFVDGWG